MAYYFPLVLTVLLIISIVICIVDRVFFAKQRAATATAGEKTKKPFLAEQARSYLVVLLVVWIVRSFLVQPFVTPTGSLKPTIMPGDFTFVSQFSYGLRMPVWRFQILPIGKVKRGSIIVVHWPVNPWRVDFVKRVIGLPGDKISYINKVLYINGQKMPQTFVKNAMDRDSVSGPSWSVKQYQEDFEGVKHMIYRAPSRPAKNFYNLIVPKGEYFLMGDNRDNSDDSRDWGFVPRKDLVGRAMMIWMSWDSAKHRIRWDRIGTIL